MICTPKTVITVKHVFKEIIETFIVASSTQYGFMNSKSFRRVSTVALIQDFIQDLDACAYAYVTCSLHLPPLLVIALSQGAPIDEKTPSLFEALDARLVSSEWRDANDTHIEPARLYRVDISSYKPDEQSLPRLRIPLPTARKLPSPRHAASCSTRTT